LLLDLGRRRYCHFGEKRPRTSTDTGVLGEPTTFITPTRKRKKDSTSDASTPTSSSTASKKNRFDPTTLGKEIHEGLESAEQLSCATKMLIHTQAHAATAEARKQADDMMLYYAAQTFNKFGIQLPNNSIITTIGEDDQWEHEPAYSFSQHLEAENE
jgi:hypothetical protein